MFLGKEKVILSMKFFAALFLLFMLGKSVKFMVEMAYEESDYSEKTIQIYEEESCNNYYFFLVYAFVLGAFWNVKKLRKVGIV